MTRCYVCSHRSEKSNCSFYRVPKSPGLRSRWMRGYRARLTSNGDKKEIPLSAYFCSCHFTAGDRRSTPKQFKGEPAFNHLFNTPVRCRRSLLKTYSQSQHNVSEEDPDDLPVLFNSQSVTPPIIVGLNDSGLGRDSIPSPASGLNRSDNFLLDSTCEESRNMTGHELNEKLANLEKEKAAQDIVVLTLEKRVSDLLSKVKNEKEEMKNLRATVSDLIGKVEDRERVVEQHSEEVKCLKEKLEKKDADLTLLEKVSKTLKQEKLIFKNKISNEKNRLHFSSLCKLDRSVEHYTGLPNAGTFYWLLSMFDAPLKYFAGWTVKCLSKEDQLFLTLMRLKRNPSRQMLADWFGISSATVTNIFVTWVSALHSVLVEGFMKNVPSREKNSLSLPPAFHLYKNCRMLIDCTEITMEEPSEIDKHNLVFSHYKKRTTMKALVCSAPNGTVTFVSDLYPGSTSDRNIVEFCGVLDILVPGDLVLADKGFLIKEILPQGVDVNIPPFLAQGQLTPAQVKETGNIARAGIHIERAIQRIKIFHILEKISHDLAPHVNQVWKVCAALSNLRNPLIRSVEDEMRPGH